MESKEIHDVQELNGIYKELDDLYHDIALKSGMSDSAFTIFYTIYIIGEGCLQRDICDQSYTSKQTVNSAIRKLENQGYLYLKQGKGRDKHIYLTDLGKEMVAKKAAPAVELEERAFMTLSEHERSELLRICRKYVKNFREMKEKCMK